MNKGIDIDLTTVKMLRLVFPVILLVLAGRAFNANAQTETNLYSFGGSPNDGGTPQAGLISGSDGNFYGTTIFGGTTGNGTIYRISPSGSETILYSFGGPPNDGLEPNGLVQGSDGNFYGTGGGGTHNEGTVFRISPGGSYSNLYSFGSQPNDGSNPPGGLVQGSDGNFYGTTSAGGKNNKGTIFRISSGGSETILYSFAGSPNDGASPQAGLVQSSDGNFYWTTVGGGTNNEGTVFRISPSASETNLYSFGGPPNDGQVPNGLVQSSDSNFYGTTQEGGPAGQGTVFRISPSGSYSNFYSFGSQPFDGLNPLGGLVQGSDGNFYGTTEGGGTSIRGTVFRISPSGTYTNLYSFVGDTGDGYDPVAGLVQGSDGNFYGTTESGGTNNAGTIFKITVPFNPPANQISSIQIASSNHIVAVPSVAGETYQLQFSSSMNPTNWVNVPGVSVTNSIGALLTLTNFGGAVGPQGFYRFDITP